MIILWFMFTSQNFIKKIQRVIKIIFKVYNIIFVTNIIYWIHKFSSPYKKGGCNGSILIGFV